MIEGLPEAIDLSIEIWKELARSGIEEKRRLPKRLWNQIKHLSCHCPLCELFIMVPCDTCPLGSCGGRSMFSKWDNAATPQQKKQSAQDIVTALEKWKKENTL